MDRIALDGRGPRRHPGRPTTLKILIADDHALFREGLRYVLRALEPHVVVLEAASAAQAMQTAAREQQLDLVLLDLAMPGLDGFAGLDMLRERFPDIPVVVVSASEEPRDVRRALDAEASGFIPKSMSGAEMMVALRSVLAGNVYVPKGIGLDDDDHHSSELRLTPRQLQVLELICEGLSNKEIAVRLGMAEGTVKIHVTAILRAMNASNRTHAVILAAQLGLTSQTA